jgi:hypothetical protein
MTRSRFTGPRPAARPARRPTCRRSLCMRSHALRSPAADVVVGLRQSDQLERGPGHQATDREGVADQAEPGAIVTEAPGHEPVAASLDLDSFDPVDALAVQLHRDRGGCGGIWQTSAALGAGRPRGRRSRRRGTFGLLPCRLRPGRSSTPSWPLTPPPARPPATSSRPTCQRPTTSVRRRPTRASPITRPGRRHGADRARSTVKLTGGSPPTDKRGSPAAPRATFHGQLRRTGAVPTVDRRFRLRTRRDEQLQTHRQIRVNTPGLAGLPRPQRALRVTGVRWFGLTAGLTTAAFRSLRSNAFENASGWYGRPSGQQNTTSRSS